MSRRSPPGRLVSTAAGYSAFIPDPLPPVLEWHSDLVRVLSDADRLVGRLSGEGARLPNPNLLTRPFVRREAVLSSRIEGTQATLGELLANEAGAAVNRAPEDLREVANYVVALEHGLKHLKRRPVSLDLVRGLHARLLAGVRGGSAEPGRFRRVQNWIGPPGCTPFDATHVPAPPEALPECLKQWQAALADRTLPPLVRVALLHYQFEAIHPFRDGNGRVGRLLVTLLLAQWQVLPAPLLYLSAFFEATRREYYDRLLGVSRHGEWEEWLAYFLTGVARQSEDAVSRAERINDLLLRWRTVAAEEAGAAALRLIDLVAVNPFLVATAVARQLGVAFTTAQRGIERLVRHGVLTEVGSARRGRVYCAKKLLDILEEPARVTARE
ncbi:Fic family protein [candidate division WOR-3 bacterium]|nr:Fic family protein [candidate division WOR-3 bacterium]